jgi:hypothetical protein
MRKSIKVGLPLLFIFLKEKYNPEGELEESGISNHSHMP